MHKEFNRFFHKRRQRDMNKVVAKRNLFDFADLLQASNVPFLLVFGTLLGAVRERDFISHDIDTDLATFSEYYTTVRNCCHSPRFAQYGFYLARHSKNLISVIRNKEYIDLYFFTDGGSEYLCLDSKIAKEQLENGFSQIEFLGRTFNTVKDPVADLQWRYGKDWRTPKRGFHAPW